MTYLRFSPPEYRTICRLCRPLNLNGCSAHALQRHLVRSLAGQQPALADRLARLRYRDRRTLHAHLRQRRRAEEGPDLTAPEFRAFAAACGPFLLQTRFLRPMRRALMQHLRDESPGLAMKLVGLSYGEFEVLCEHVKERIRGGA